MAPQPSRRPPGTGIAAVGGIMIGLLVIAIFVIFGIVLIVAFL